MFWEGQARNLTILHAGVSGSNDNFLGPKVTYSKVTYSWRTLFCDITEVIKLIWHWICEDKKAFYFSFLISWDENFCLKEWLFVSDAKMIVSK